jgi:hypothetical protein
MGFVEREFEIGDDRVICRFFEPTMTPKHVAPGGEYRCDYTISWPDHDRRSYACGIDSIQALSLAMRSAFSDLENSKEYKSGSLTYLGEVPTAKWGLVG